jgi:hypothetical protein
VCLNGSAAGGDPVPEDEMTDTIKLDGRTFAGISQAITASQDDYILGHLREAGAIDVLSELDGKGPRTREQKAEEMLTRILLSGRKHFILAGCLTETGKTWSREEADRNAAVFAKLTDVEDKRALQSGIVEFVVGFFSAGETLPTISQNSSRRSAEAKRTKNAALSN